MAIAKNIIFKINGEDYGMDIMRVNAILRKQNVTSIPYGMPCIDGVITSRGQVIPVYSLYKKFKMSPSPINRETKWIVTTVAGLQVAFQVDTVSEIVTVDEKENQEKPNIVNNEDTNYVKNVIRMHGKIVVILDIDNLLSIKEVKNVNDMMKEYHKN